MKESVGRMRVAIVAFGHADNVVSLSHSLAKYADVTLIFVTAGNRFTRSLFDWDLSKLPYGLTTDLSMVRERIDERILNYVDSRVKIYIARTPTRKLIKDWKRKNLKYIRDVAEYLCHNSFDVIHFNGFSGFQLYFHWFLRRFPKVYTIHDYLPHSGEWRKGPVIFNRLFSRLDYQFIQHYQFLAKEFSKFYGVEPKRVHTVYCGPFEIYRVFMNNTVHEEPNTVLFFGRISPYKGIEYLVDALPEIKKSIPDARLIIAGKGNFWFSVEHSEGLEIHNRHIPNEELVNLIQRASIVAAPYIDATHSAVIMTAYAFRKPVVASAVGGIPEVVEDNVTGRLVPPRNAHAIADTITDLLTKPEKRNRMKANIEKKCTQSRLSWNYIAKKTMRVYSKALEKSK